MLDKFRQVGAGHRLAAREDHRADAEVEGLSTVFFSSSRESSRRSGSTKRSAEQWTHRHGHRGVTDSVLVAGKTIFSAIDRSLRSNGRMAAGEGIADCRGCRSSCAHVGDDFQAVDDGQEGVDAAGDMPFSGPETSQAIFFSAVRHVFISMRRTPSGPVATVWTTPARPRWRTFLRDEACLR